MSDRIVVAALAVGFGLLAIAIVFAPAAGGPEICPWLAGECR